MHGITMGYESEPFRSEEVHQGTRRLTLDYEIEPVGVRTGYALSPTVYAVKDFKIEVFSVYL